MKRLLLLGVAVFFLGTCRLFAQQEKLFTQYLNYPASINPAYVGSTGGSQLMLIYRDQWTSFDGAPKSGVLSGNTLLKRYNIGVGATFDYDQIGVTKTTEGALDLSYRLQVSKESHLQFGLKTIMSHYRVSFSELEKQHYDDQVVAYDIDGEVNFNIGLGFYLVNPKYYIGVSVPKVLEQQANTLEGNLSREKSFVQRHYYIMGGYLFDLTPSLKIWPSTMVRITEGAPVSFDVRAMLVMHDKLWFGPSYRYDSSVSAILQYQLTHQLRMGYSYDFMTTEISSYAGGTHEFTLRYDFNLPAKKMKSPRYF
ncbi:PorP/SprF family type IX secretion system membrane protein [Aureibacter tunicatorum]|uniref:Type IX secretion system PorP/SprF family membrane protein n=1 Tax=Aureibacter tunicatorum TaxID=866807 RepID=A0AAE3XM68_9BACT|nr:type IX secretion system membrane protein PorP/SprF [Aureibacter tunicatorum]MDR6239045.1 type IX secretion system PorP/SprF family membrane protein [Aureibacter tunicatorum]BDD05029.1 membrane protein [Aureibacter tunicatorum]